MEKLEIEVQAKSSAEKLWAAFKDSSNLFPKFFPNHIKSIEVIQGDGYTVGSFRLIKYAQGTPIMTFGKEKLEVADEEKKVISYRVIDGELTRYYKSYTATLQVVPKSSDGEEGCWLKWRVDFEKASEEVHDPILLLEYAARTFNRLDALLLNA
ncbi:hypothetical protein Scep_017729 [Stephania cephalantha]|uniref:Bet v I/Major latex protein domain-containing protein n=1 Tax=Stephania cephalantha TaxID=152367 RepID=A0AAP0NX76_9MAGN